MFEDMCSVLLSNSSAMQEMIASVAMQEIASVAMHQYLKRSTYTHLLNDVGRAFQYDSRSP